MTFDLDEGASPDFWIYDSAGGGAEYDSLEELERAAAEALAAGDPDTAAALREATDFFAADFTPQRWLWG